VKSGLSKESEAMSRGRVVAWLILFAAGFGLMYWSYHRTAGASASFPLRVALLIPRGEQTEKPADAALPVSVRFLPSGDPDVSAIADALRQTGANGDRTADAFLYGQQEAVILLPEFDAVFRDDMLASGRLPVAGKNEVLAGCAAVHKDALTVEGQTLNIVGVLSATGRPLSHAYLLPGPQRPPGLFDSAEADQPGFLLVQPQDEKAGPAKVSGEKWIRVETSLRVAPGDFYLYFAGMAFMLAAGSALFVTGYVCLAGRIKNRWLGPPLAEIERRVKLLVGMHVAYFGLYLAGALLIHELPIIQDSFRAVVAGQLESGQGLLGKAGDAYATKNIALAAGATLAINFLVGSLLFITLPSVVVPGAGLLGSLFRAGLWGLLLAPTDLALARALIPHAGTLLLEGEGYILATFFALLVPIYLFSPKEGSGVGRRYLLALILNLKGNFLVLIVLAAAAVYEATEVILQMSA
jgi:hypothetical protein